MFCIVWFCCCISSCGWGCVFPKHLVLFLRRSFKALLSHDHRGQYNRSEREILLHSIKLKGSRIIDCVNSGIQRQKIHTF